MPPLDAVVQPLISTATTQHMEVEARDGAPDADKARVPEAQAAWDVEIDMMLAERPEEADMLALVRDFIHNGVRLPFISEPEHRHYPNTPSVQEHFDAVANRIADYERFGAVERIDEPPDGYWHPLHAVVRQGKKVRVVLDLSRNLNDCLARPSQRYESVQTAADRSYQGCWYGKLDLSNMYLSFPVAKEHQHHFRFKLGQEFRRFTAVPFGLGPASRIMTDLMAVVAHKLARHGIRHVRYLDDLLLIAPSEEQARTALSVAADIIASFGLVLNSTKTEGPAQRMEFLGVMLDSIQGTLSLSVERVQQLRDESRRMLRASRVSRAVLQTYAGKLAFAAQVLPGAKPFSRRIFDAITALPTAGSRTRTGRFAADIRHWLNNIEHWQGQRKWRPAEPEFEITSDASPSGFAFVVTKAPQRARHLMHILHIGTWEGKDKQRQKSHRDIMAGELFAILAAAFTLSTLLKDSAVHFVTDNMPDSHAINRGRVRNPGAAVVLRALADLASFYNFAISSSHIKGEDNTLADFGSRPALHRFRPLERVRLYSDHPVRGFVYVRSSRIHLPEVQHERQTQPLRELSDQCAFSLRPQRAMTRTRVTT